MRIGKVLKTGVLGGLISLIPVSCKKSSNAFYPAHNVPQRMINKINSLKQQTNIVTRDYRYECFGDDTLKITEDVFNGTRIYLNKMNKNAVKNTPKIKSTNKFRYTNQKTVIISEDIFTKTGEDIYVPVKYYGMPSHKTAF